MQVLQQFLLRAPRTSSSAPAHVGEWLSLVEHLVRDQGVGGSNPLSPTIYFNPVIELADFPALNSLASGRTHLRARFIDHGCPDAFGFQNQFYGFADRTVASHRFRRVVGSFLDFGYGISYRYSQSHTTQ